MRAERTDAAVLGQPEMLSKVSRTPWQNQGNMKQRMAAANAEQHTSSRYRAEMGDRGRKGVSSSQWELLMKVRQNKSSSRLSQSPPGLLNSTSPLSRESQWEFPRVTAAFSLLMQKP